MMQYTTEQIREILPHRYPFLLIDRIVDGEPGVSATAVKCVTANEPFFQGHFPGYAVMPGVLLLEAIAQTGAVALLQKPENQGKIGLFGGVDNAKFRAQVVPGDVLTITTTITRTMGVVGKGKGTVYVSQAGSDDPPKLACSAEITFALTDAPC